MRWTLSAAPGASGSNALEAARARSMNSATAPSAGRSGPSATGSGTSSPPTRHTCSPGTPRGWRLVRSPGSTASAQAARRPGQRSRRSPARSCPGRVASIPGTSAPARQARDRWSALASTRWRPRPAGPDATRASRTGRPTRRRRRSPGGSLPRARSQAASFPPHPVHTGSADGCTKPATAVRSARRLADEPGEPDRQVPKRPHRAAHSSGWLCSGSVRPPRHRGSAVAPDSPRRRTGAEILKTRAAGLNAQRKI